MDTHVRIEEEDDVRIRDVAEQPTFEEVVEQHLSRRAILGAAAAAPFLAMPGVVPFGSDGEAHAQAVNTVTFGNVAETPGRASPPYNVTSDVVNVPPGYKYNVVIKWGDPLFPGVGPFDPNNQSPADARQRFGFNNDMIALFPERFGAPASIGRLPYPSYIMATNHEYVVPQTAFPSIAATGLTVAQTNTLLEYLGVGVVRISLRNGDWVFDQNSRFNRRITMTTPIDITGPAAGHPKMRTSTDPNGTRVLGTYGNCAGGFTPWGTYLTAEENVDLAFVNRSATGVADARVQLDHTDMGLRPGVVNQPDLSIADPRFDVGTPAGQNELYRFGWIVEIDPYDPSSTPKKRTALGRFKHECATTCLTADDTCVLYSGDDQRFEYVYKFVTAGKFDRSNPRSSANMNLLDSGTLYVARFNADGTGQWFPLDINNPTTGPLIRASTYPDGTARFQSQGDVVINARRAGDQVGATPMDRPEDVEAPVDDNFRGRGKVYFTLTNNSNRTGATPLTNSDTRRTGSGRQVANATDAVNPRLRSIGSIIELTEAGNNHAATTFTWRIFMQCGDPANPTGVLPSTSSFAGAGQDTRLAGTTVSTFVSADNINVRFSAPDNVAFDKLGNIWIATDGSPEILGQNDQVLVAPTTTPAGQSIPTKRFLTAPNGAEVCGPLLSPDNTTFFCAMQHPGEDAASFFANPQSVWPDNVAGVHNNNTPPAAANRFPKPAVIAVRRTDGGRVGS